MAGAHVAHTLTRIPGLMIMSYAFRCVFHHRMSEIIYISHAKHMIAHIKHQYRRISRRKLPERGLFRHPIERETIIAQFLDSHDMPPSTFIDGLTARKASIKPSRSRGESCRGNELFITDRSANLTVTLRLDSPMVPVCPVDLATSLILDMGYL